MQRKQLTLLRMHVYVFKLLSTVSVPAPSAYPASAPLLAMASTGCPQAVGIFLHLFQL